MLPDRGSPCRRQFSTTDAIPPVSQVVGGTTQLALAANIATATSTTPMQNRSGLVTRSGLPLTARREVVPRAISSVSQTRVWNLLIDVVAQSGRRYRTGETDPKKFIVEGEQHYWVHVAIDRFYRASNRSAGGGSKRVIDQQLAAGTNSSRSSYSVISYSDASRVICYSVITSSWELGASSKTLIIGNPETLKLDQGRFLSFGLMSSFSLSAF